MTSPARRQSRLKDLSRLILRERGAWLLVGIGLVFFFRVLVAGHTLYFRDLLLLYLPGKELLASYIRAGEWPLWNPYLNGGMPFLADLSSAILYPSGLLYVVLNRFTALNLELTLHVLLAGLSAYALARALGFSQLPSFTAGLVYSYCGYALSLMNLSHWLLSMPYLPLTLIGWHLLVSRGRRRFLVMAVAAGVLQILTGAPEAVAVTQATALVWVLGAYPGSASARLRRGSLFLVAGLLILGLSAVQLVPTVELVSRSIRGEGLSFESWATWSVPPARLPELVLPGVLGPFDTLIESDYWGEGLVDQGFPLILSLYFGWLTLGLAVTASLGGSDATLSRTARRLLFAIAAASLIASLGRWLPLAHHVYDLVPQLKLMRFPVKFLSAAILPIALLAAAGLEALDRAPRPRLRVVALIACGLAASVFAAALALRAGLTSPQVWLEAYFHHEIGHDALRALTSACLHAGSCLLAAALFLFARSSRPRSWQPVGIASLVALDLLVSGRGINPVAPRNRFQVPADTLAAVRSATGEGRLYRGRTPSDLLIAAPSNDASWRYGWETAVLADQRAIEYEIPVVFHRDIADMAPLRARKMTSMVGAVPWSRRLPLLSAAGVHAILTHEVIPGIEPLGSIANQSNHSIFLYRNPDASEPLQLVHNAEITTSDVDALNAMLQRGFDARQEVILEGSLPMQVNSRCNSGVDVTWHVRRPSLWRAELTNRCPGYLVITEPPFKGWSIRVDGHPTKVLHANYMFSAIWLSAGEHTFERRYLPTSVLSGAVISLTTALVLGASLLIPLPDWPQRFLGPCRQPR